jgi:ribosomal protein S18 acetylase RimI-like enzyme
MINELFIRPMTIDDYERVCALWMSCKNMGFNNLDDSRAGIGRFLARNPNTCLLAGMEGEIAGVILAGHDGRRGYIYHMAVAEEHRRNGVGTALVERCLEALRVEGIHKVALVAFKYNEAGNAFWEKMGFTVREDLNYRNRALSEMKRIDT